MLLTLERVSLAFGHLPLFSDASLQIDAGERLALIGRNGSGKSSLLKVLSGETPADTGTIWRSPALRIARLDQAAFAGDGAPSLSGVTAREEIRRGLPAVDPAAEEAWRGDQRVDYVISRLGIPADRPFADLSGGWRRRTLLAKALVSDPDLLLLDEPTNHLDIEAIRWVQDFVRDFKGAVLVVTHDRAFLAAIATRIVDLDRGRLTSWPGSYSAYLEKKAAAIEDDARALARLDKKLEKEEAWLRQGVKARRTRNEGRVRDLLKLRAERAAVRGHAGEVRMSVDASVTTGKLVFEAEAVTKQFDGRSVISQYSQRIMRGDRIGLIGPNGSGKTTLLRMLVGELEPDAGTVRRGTNLQVAYFDQKREELDPERTVADTVNDGNTTIAVNGTAKHVIGYLADFLFPRERAVSPVKSLSGGERNRLLLARLFAKPANVLVLDEPTNDLDIETLELLEELVGEFPGTVLLVSHDRVFIDRVVTSTLAFEGGGRVAEYVGGYEDYLRQKSRATETGGRTTEDRGRRPDSGRVAAAGGQAAGARQRRLSYNEQRELAALPGAIDALEAEQKALHEEAASQEFYKATPEHISGVLSRIDGIQAELDVALERWIELQEVGDTR